MTARENSKWSERYEAFIKNSSEGIWLFEFDKPVPTKLTPAEQVQWMYKYAYLAETNEAAAAMYGASPEEQIGGRLNEFLPASDPLNIEYLTAFVESGYRLIGAESHEKDTAGNDKYFRNSLIGIIEDKHLLRAWGTQQDITERHLITKALQKSEERLALALHVSSMGIWEWDIPADILTWSAELKELYGLKPEAEITYTTYLNLVHPDDLETVQKTIREARELGTEYRVEHRVLWPDGTIHWILGQGKALMENGKAVRMIGTGMNIETNKRKAELEEINKKLRQHQHELVALNRSKDEFISLASHQLRTPATGVKQYLGLLLENYAGKMSEAQRELLEIAYSGNERQLAVINDLLKVAQVDAGKMRLSPEDTDVTALLRTIIADQADEFKQRRQKIVLHAPKIPITILADSRWLRMALENLIDNASKYTPDCKTITVEAASSKTNLKIHIKDEGIGIDKADIPRLFQKFSRLDNSLASNIDGTGLGLYVAKKIVNLHKGTLTVRSEPGTGSTFTIMLPRHKN